VRMQYPNICFFNFCFSLTAMGKDINFEKACNHLFAGIHLSQSFDSWGVDGLYQFSSQPVPVQLSGYQLQKTMFVSNAGYRFVSIFIYFRWLSVNSKVFH